MSGIGPKEQGKRQKILEASLAVFSRKGYGETTIPDIAAEAGVAVGTIYHYYESKRALLLSLIQTYVTSERLGQLFISLAEEEEETSLRDLIENGLDWAADDLQGFIFVFSEIIRDAELRRRFASQCLGAILQSLEKYISDRISRGDFRELDPRIAARTLVGLIMGFVLVRQMEGEYSPIRVLPLPKLTDNMTGILLEGLQKRGEAYA